MELLPGAPNNLVALQSATQNVSVTDDQVRQVRRKIVGASK